MAKKGEEVDMLCTAYIVTRTDGFFARADGSVDWLESAGNPEFGMGEGYIDVASYIATVDCMVMSRKCMEMISSFDLPSEQWPYGTMKIFVLSSSVQTPPRQSERQSRIVFRRSSRAFGQT